MFYIPWVGMLWFASRNASKQNKLHPKEWTQKYSYYEKSIKTSGLSIDWNLEIATCDKDY